MVAVRALQRRLRDHRRLDDELQTAVCAAACAHAQQADGAAPPVAAAGANATIPAGGGRRPPPLLPGCLCDAAPVRADCGCRVGGGPGPHFSMDATPMLHRLPGPPI